MVKQKPCRIGDLVKVKHVHGGYRLPDGLPEGAEVRVLSFEAGYREVEYHGRTFRVFMAAIDTGLIPCTPATPPPRPPLTH